jgi:hypothetical protein
MKLPGELSLEVHLDGLPDEFNPAPTNLGSKDDLKLINGDHLFMIMPARK